jgi:hypothetical protein
MRPTFFASAMLALLLSSSSYAAAANTPTDTPPAQGCQRDHLASPAAAGEAGGYCDPHGPRHGEDHHLPPPPPHEPPLAAVKACLGKKAGSKTTIYVNGDSIPAVCQHYDGMILAKPLQPLPPPALPQHPEDVPR